MKKVLIVDDDRSLLESLAAGLAPFVSLQVLTADNGPKALQILANNTIDAVVTDLKMPDMDGFELLAIIGREHPSVPVIVMTAFSSFATLQRTQELGAITCLDKPFEIDVLSDRLFAVLRASESSFLKGFSVATFLQLLSMERKTCTLKVTAGNRSGLLSFVDGVLIDAETGKLTGDDAAMDIVSWQDATIELQTICKVKSPSVHSDIQYLIMESIRTKDEAAGKNRIADTAPAQLDEAIDEGWVADEVDSASKQKYVKEIVMALEKHLQQLRDIKGYKASAIMNFTGEVIASDSADPSVDLGIVGATFNDIFRSAHAASIDIGLEACTETVIKTPKGVIVMQCSGIHSRVHFHAISVLSADGNQALLRMRLDKIVPAVMAEL